MVGVSLLLVVVGCCWWLLVVSFDAVDVALIGVVVAVVVFVGCSSSSGFVVSTNKKHIKTKILINKSNRKRQQNPLSL